MILSGDCPDAVLELLPAVRREVRRSGCRVDVDEQHADGLVGLWEAWLRFDPDRGVPFGAYALPRIRGAITDGMRARDHLTRRGRELDPDAPPPLRLDRPLTDDGATLADLVADPADDVAELLGDLEHTDRLARLDLAVRRLPARLRTVVEHRIAGHTHAAAAAELGVSESRVCQLHDEAVRRLRRDPDLAPLLAA